MDTTTLYKFSSGLYIIGSKDKGRDVGCVVNTVTQATATPITLITIINKDNYTNECIKKTGQFSVSILSESASPELFGTFGFRSSRDFDKFETVKSSHTPSGMPYLEESCVGYLQCKVIDSIEDFTHTIFIAEVEEAANLSSDPPITYEYYHRVVKLKAPKNASTYVGEAADEAAWKAAYKCKICGYVYDGAPGEFEALPDSWKCPVCSMEKSMFELKQE
ncbi:MAG: flavin reductase [Eubacteriaceae bacterium]|nr:flavin reductase [Eubacteriaceae bacterium]